MRKLRFRQVAQLVVVLLCAFGVKWHYSTAAVDQLRWVLAPTTALVEFVTGARFTFESHAGYMNSEHTFLIAASCAGVNFFITAFLMLMLQKLWKDRDKRVRWRFIPVAASIAYTVTLVANTVRISLALQLLAKPGSNWWLDAGELHRLEGILVYFGFLLLLFVLAEDFDARARGFTGRTAMSAILSRVWFPLVVYYAMTLGIPLLNGGYAQGKEFRQHAAFVLLAPLALVAPVIFIRSLVGRTARAGCPRPADQDAGAPISLRPRRGLAHPTMFTK
jgi:exosortase K